MVQMKAIFFFFNSNARTQVRYNFRFAVIMLKTTAKTKRYTQNFNDARILQTGPELVYMY